MKIENYLYSFPKQRLILATVSVLGLSTIYYFLYRPWLRFNFSNVLIGLGLAIGFLVIRFIFEKYSLLKKAESSKSINELLQIAISKSLFEELFFRCLLLGALLNTSVPLAYILTILFSILIYLDLKEPKDSFKNAVWQSFIGIVLFSYYIQTSAIFPVVFSRFCLEILAHCYPLIEKLSSKNGKLRQI